MKFAILVGVLLTLVSCDFFSGDDSSSSSGPECLAAPSGATESGPGPCPTPQGMWDKYYVVKDAQGNYTTRNKYCNTPEVDVFDLSDIENQATMNGGTYNNDFIGTSTCVSGSYTKNSEVTQFIFYKK